MRSLQQSTDQRTGGQSEKCGRKRSKEGKNEKKNFLEQSREFDIGSAGKPPEVAKWKRKHRT